MCYGNHIWMNMNFEGKVAIITGASTGIGRETAKQLAMKGAIVVINARARKPGRQEPRRRGSFVLAKKVAEEIRSMGGKAIAIEADVTNREAVDKMVSEVIDKFGKIDILINNAGKSYGPRHPHLGFPRDPDEPPPLEDLSYEDWHRNIDTNFNAVFYMCKAVVPHMRKRKYGKIINVSSGAGRMYSRTGITAYAAAKAGQIGFTRQLAKDVARDGIYVNCIAPGLIQKDPNKFPYEDTVGKEAILESIPLGRTGTVEEAAKAIVFLVSDDASYIVGQTLGVDGGRWMNIM